MEVVVFQFSLVCSSSLPPSLIPPLPSLGGPSVHALPHGIPRASRYQDALSCSPSPSQRHRAQALGSQPQMAADPGQLSLESPEGWLGTQRQGLQRTRQLLAHLNRADATALGDGC